MSVPTHVTLVGRTTATILGPEPVRESERSCIPAIERLICAHVPGATTVLIGGSAASRTDAKSKAITCPIPGVADPLVIGVRAPYQAPTVGEWWEIITD